MPINMYLRAHADDCDCDHGKLKRHIADIEIALRNRHKFIREFNLYLCNYVKRARLVSREIYNIVIILIFYEFVALLVLCENFR